MESRYSHRNILRIHHNGQYTLPFHGKSAAPLSLLLPGTTELHGSVSVHRWTENKIPSLTYLIPPVIHLDIVSVRCQCFIRRTDDLIHILQLFQTVCAPSYDSRCCKYRCLQCLWQIQHLIYQTTVEVNIGINTFIHSATFPNYFRCQSFYLRIQ